MTPFLNMTYLFYTLIQKNRRCPRFPIQTSIKLSQFLLSCRTFLSRFYRFRTAADRFYQRQVTEFVSHRNYSILVSARVFANAGSKKYVTCNNIITRGKFSFKLTLPLHFILSKNTVFIVKNYPMQFFN